MILLNSTILTYRSTSSSYMGLSLDLSVIAGKERADDTPQEKERKKTNTSTHHINNNHERSSTAQSNAYESHTCRFVAPSMHENGAGCLVIVSIKLPSCSISGLLQWTNNSSSFSRSISIQNLTRPEFSDSCITYRASDIKHRLMTALQH